MTDIDVSPHDKTSLSKEENPKRQEEEAKAKRTDEDTLEPKAEHSAAVATNFLHWLLKHCRGGEEDFSSSKKGLVPRRIRWIYSTHGDDSEKQGRGQHVSLLNMAPHSCERCWKTPVCTRKLKTWHVLPLPFITQKAKHRHISQYSSCPTTLNVLLPLLYSVIPRDVLQTHSVPQPSGHSRLTWGGGCGGSGASNLLQPGGGTGTVIPKMFGGLLDVLLQEIVAGYAVSSHSAVEQPQLVVKDFDLQVEPKLTVKSDWLAGKPKTLSSFKRVFAVTAVASSPCSPPAASA